ncbi:hypothetical protein FZEAL_2224 [Fusarium zealandicum]|uniref:Peptidase M14 domain-containing protein n=1 Tax=Fusarium zealandicum TaxID=1053134 RepID=A0A8H4URX9_9HYPO|nr:hypothetical protein FZEAL_2224 [Fusarium zealandicum]
MRLHLLTFALSASACLLPSDVNPRNKRRDNHYVARQVRPEPDFAIGTGDRFENGTIAPKGLSTLDRDLKSILTPAEVSSALVGLADAFEDDIELIRPPFKTHEGVQILGASVGKKPKLFIISGVHARERGGPDNVVYFISDLLHARKAKKGLKYGKTSYSAAQVRKVLDAGIVVLPLINPDGVKYDQATDECWRKNRNPASATGEDDIGIDINRNYDFLWDYESAFSPDADLGSVASNDPASEVFHGTEPASEPETKSVVWTMDEFKDLSWFVDLHSFGGSVLYAWGDDNAQTKKPGQSFANEKYDGRRGVTGDDEPPKTAYKEYIKSQDLAGQKTLGNRMKAAMERAGETLYEVMESVGLYPTSGASTDYALGRYYGDTCGASKLQGFTIEFGEESGSEACPFYPSGKQYHSWMRQVASGLMEVALKAADTKTETKKC